MSSSPPAGYPKTIRLKDGNTVLVRFMEQGDRDLLLEFFRGVPEEERMFLREDITRPEVIDTRVRAGERGRLVWLVGEAGGKIVADATLQRRLTNWLQHVAEVHVVVDSAYRRLGLAYRLLYELFDLAREQGIETLLGEVMAEQEAVMSLLERLGFRREATLRGLVKDLQGRRHDLVIMTRDLTRKGETLLRWFSSPLD
ncbi:MAG: GNAT family N-acetyltransferase [Deltaproteobacteria bacterium]|nr:GNAT family N-acetyltransferase [Deltaproteobacteria bacterium]